MYLSIGVTDIESFGGASNSNPAVGQRAFERRASLQHRFLNLHSASTSGIIRRRMLRRESERCRDADERREWETRGNSFRVVHAGRIDGQE